MPRRRRLRRALASPFALAVQSLLAVASCGHRGEVQPVATLAASPPAAASFAAIEEGWSRPETTTLRDLRLSVERFLAEFPTDGLVPRAHVMLALVAMKDPPDLATADAQLALTGSLPPGSTRDLWTIARARRLRIGGSPDAAFGLLRPLVGKPVDPLGRSLLDEELTLVALATHREYEAISYMDSWLRGATEDDKDEVEEKVSALVERLPRDVLVGALQAMRAERVQFGYGVEVERILAARLVRLATTSGDSALARLLLDPDAGAVVANVAAGDAGVELGVLATSRRGLNVVAGRTIGLLLPTASPALRDESADVLRGVMWALGLPRGVRVVAPSPPPAGDGGAGDAPSAPCAPLEPAPAFDEPMARDVVRLITRDDTGRSADTEASLDELLGQGAAIIVAGLDPDTAGRALAWGAARGVPVIALATPNSDVASRAPAAAPAPDPSFDFRLDEPRPDVLAALVRAAPALEGSAIVPLLDASEDRAGTWQPRAASGASADLSGGPLSFAAPVLCDMPPPHAGEPRFPVRQWDHDHVQNWLVSGSPFCANQVAAELDTAKARGIVALLLEAAALPPHPPGLRVVTAWAGVVPAVTDGDPRQEELSRFATALGAMTWWTALGRDAGTLARLAVRSLPLDTAAEAAQVGERRKQARDRLGAARARLWTTEAAGWGESHVMTRSVCTLDGPVSGAGRGRGR